MANGFGIDCSFEGDLNFKALSPSMIPARSKRQMHGTARGVNYFSKQNGQFDAKWPETISLNSGTCFFICSSWGTGLRGQKLHPDGGFNGLGGSPCNTMRLRVRSNLGSGIGIALIKARV